MKRTFGILVLAAVLCLGVMGCGGEQQSSSAKKTKPGAGGGPPDVTTAADLAQEQDAQPINPMQMNCIVCGERPLKGDLHADVTVGNQRGRLYFDKQECLDEFEQNQQKYLDRLTQ